MSKIVKDEQNVYRGEGGAPASEEECKPETVVPQGSSPVATQAEAPPRHDTMIGGSLRHFNDTGGHKLMVAASAPTGDRITHVKVLFDTHEIENKRVDEATYQRTFPNVGGAISLGYLYKLELRVETANGLSEVFEDEWTGSQ